MRLESSCRLRRFGREMAGRKCWICGAVADTAEHMVKASDFRSVFGPVTQNSPAYRQSKVRRNEPIRGANAELLKFEPSLCGFCNSTRTQPHDRAWQKLSEFVRHARHPFRPGSRLPLQTVFPASVKESMLGVHLYFLKLLGCQAVEHGIPLPINHFAMCLLSGLPNQNLRLVFVSVPAGSSAHKIQVGAVDALNIGGKTVSAAWFYRVENLGVVMSYCEAGHPRLIRDRGWNPSDVCSRIMMA